MGVGGGAGGGVEWRGVAPVRRAGKVDRGGGGMDSRRWQMVEKSRTTVGHARERGKVS
jgi:hypothetical protein